MNSRMMRCWCAVVFAISMLGATARATDEFFFAPMPVAWGATNSHVIVPPIGSKVAVVRSIQVVSDLYDSRLTFFTNAAPGIVYADSTGTNIHLLAGTESGGTNGFVAGNIVIICHGGGGGVNDTYERALVHAVGTTNVSLTTALGRTATAGSLFYRCGTNQVLKGYTNTTTLNSFIAVGQRGQPMLIDASGTAAVNINLLNGEYK